jgi:hypothetical protein
MKTFANFTIAALTVFGTALTANADWLASQPDSLLKFNYQVVTKYMSPLTEADGIKVYDKDADIAYRVFCTDLFTSTSRSFSSGGGQKYNPVALELSTFHSDTQKAQLQSLFDHVYTKAFNADYSYNDPFYASIFNLAVWEIVHETSGALSLESGDLYIRQAYERMVGTDERIHNVPNAKFLAKALATTADWFDAILNGSWEDYGYSEDKVNLTVWIAEGGTKVSQTFIGVAPTPEPATMLILGLGITGLGIARRRMAK